MRNRFFIPGVSVILVLVGVAVWHFSAYVYGQALLTAIQTNDYGKLSRIADVDRMGESLRDALAGAMPQSVSQVIGLAKKTDTGQRVADTVKGVATRSLGSPRALAEILRGEGFLGADMQNGAQSGERLKRTIDTEMRYGDSHDVFLVLFRAQQTGEEATVVMERTGIFVWKATAIRISSASFLLPYSGEH